MIVISTIMRMLEGVKLRIRLTEKLESVVTKITAKHMVIVVSSFVVTASAEQMPRIWTAMGLFVKTGSKRASFALLAMSASYFELFENRPVPLLAEPEANEVLHAPGGEGGSGESVDLVDGVGLRTAFDDLDVGLPLRVVRLLADPRLLPLGIVDLAPQAGRLAVLVERHDLDGGYIAIKADETVHPPPHA